MFRPLQSFIVQWVGPLPIIPLILCCISEWRVSQLDWNIRLLTGPTEPLQRDYVCLFVSAFLTVSYFTNTNHGDFLTNVLRQIFLNADRRELCRVPGRVWSAWCGGSCRCVTELFGNTVRKISDWNLDLKHSERRHEMPLLFAQFVRTMHQDMPKTTFWCQAVDF